MSEQEEATRHASKLEAEEWDEILKLTHAAFAEHLQKGICMFPCTASMEQYKEFLKDCQISMIRIDGKLAAYKAGFIMNHPDHTHLQMRATSVHPSYKGKGLGKKVHRLLEDWATKEGCAYMQTDTSCKAKSSQAYHHSCGFEDWYYVSHPTTNYYSIVMRKELPEGRKMSRKLRYSSLVRSFLTIHLLYKANGQERSLYKWLKRLIQSTP